MDALCEIVNYYFYYMPTNYILVGQCPFPLIFVKVQYVLLYVVFISLWHFFYCGTHCKPSHKSLTIGKYIPELMATVGKEVSLSMSGARILKCKYQL